MKHGNPEQSIERRQDYKDSLKDIDNEVLLQTFVGVYLDQDFQTDFDKWMAEQDVIELKRRLVHFVG
jgi:hypothetical protein